MNVVTYARVSTKEQGENGYSLHHQKDFLEKYCAIKGYNIINHYREDYSAKNFDRPEWNSLISFIKNAANKIGGIVFTRWDRFSRNVGDSYQQIKELEKLKVKVISADQHLDLSVPENKYVLSMFLVHGEVENDKNSIRTIEGQRAAMKEGCFIARAPFGYDNVRDKNGNSTLEANKNAWIVKKAFELFSSGAYQMEEVRQIIKKDGYKCNKESFRLLLRRDVYRGKVYIKEYREEPAQIVEGLHEAIVTDELFNTVQNILKGRNKQAFKVNKLNPSLPLRGYLECNRCGGKLTGSRSTGNGGKYYYYHCQRGCSERFSALEANNKFIAYLDSLKFDWRIVELYKEILKDLYKNKKGFQDRDLNKLEEKSTSLEEMIDNITDKYVRDKINYVDYIKHKNRYLKKLELIEKEIRETKERTRKVEQCLNRGIPIISNLRKFYVKADVTDKQLLISSIIGENIIFKDGNYRTNQLNSVISLLLEFKPDFNLRKKKKVDDFINLSNMAPPLGLEPRTY